MDQEIWITFRVKGYTNAELDVPDLAKKLASHVSKFCDGTNVLVPLTANVVEVIEIEEEADIYLTEGPGWYALYSTKMYPTPVRVRIICDDEPDRITVQFQDGSRDYALRSDLVYEVAA